MVAEENSFSSTFFLGKPGSIWQHCVKPQSLLVKFPWSWKPTRGWGWPGWGKSTGDGEGGGCARSLPRCLWEQGGRSSECRGDFQLRQLAGQPLIKLCGGGLGVQALSSVSRLGRGCRDSSWAQKCRKGSAFCSFLPASPSALTPHSTPCHPRPMTLSLPTGTLGATRQWPCARRSSLWDQAPASSLPAWIAHSSPRCTGSSRWM